MLSAILSDTVMFKSVTTTDEDKERAKELAEIAGIADIGSLCYGNVQGQISRLLAKRLEN
ncbi:MAG: manganese-dependent inorganic pyrophosphatase [Candidatus Methanoperedenaceae archaeon GB37]|nr:manganese-dependent inorganic pyrophosphatase [Candidatus Methanoperedenaceae archaeon GB37]CAD7782686.1 MAG: manganese-dependent inorganic pyrophosphatase [Candidatus Methanoperedenaceae archaeon GB37]